MRTSYAVFDQIAVQWDQAAFEALPIHFGSVVPLRILLINMGSIAAGLAIWEIAFCISWKWFPAKPPA